MNYVYYKLTFTSTKNEPTAFSMIPRSKNIHCSCSRNNTGRALQPHRQYIIHGRFMNPRSRFKEDNHEPLYTLTTTTLLPRRLHRSTSHSLTQWQSQHT